MELLQGLEVYIPPEAEVKSVPLLSLSSSLRRKMGLSAGLDSLPDSPLCVWISPALFQRKGQKDLPQSSGTARQQVLSLLSNSQACPSLTKGYGQCKMSFVTSHRTAYRVLKETLSMGSNTQLCSSPSVPEGVLSSTEVDAVIIHQGRVYLSVKKNKKQAAKPHSIATGHVVPVIHNKLKRKQNSPSEATNKSRSKPSARQQGAAQSQGPSAEAAQSQESSAGTSQSCSASVGAPHSHSASAGGPHSHSASVGAPQSLSASVGAPQSLSASVGAGHLQGDSRDQEPPEEFSDQHPGPALYCAQHNDTELYDPSERLAHHVLDPSEPRIDYEELACRERIALMKAKLE